MRILPPLGVIRLKNGCQATSNLISLPPIYELKSRSNTVIRSQLDILEKMSRNNFSLWEPIEKAGTNWNLTWDTGQLDKIKEIHIQDLIEKLNGLNKPQINEDIHWSWSIYIFILVGIPVFISITIICRKRIRECLGKKSELVYKEVQITDDSSGEVNDDDNPTNDDNTQQTINHNNQDIELSNMTQRETNLQSPTTSSATTQYNNRETGETELEPPLKRKRKVQVNCDLNRIYPLHLAVEEPMSTD